MKLPRMGNIPESFSIGSKVWKIQFRKIIEEDKEVLGLCDPDGIITIKIGLSRTDLLATLIHELLHAFEFEYGIKTRHEQIYQFEQAILEFMIDNF